MTSVSQLGYLGFKVSNLDAWESFATQILGIESVGRNENGALMFRIDEYQYRFVFEQGAKDDLDVIGWQVEDERSLGAVADQLKAAGIEVQRGSAEEAEARRVVELIKFRDPSGIASEAFYGPLTRIDVPFKPAQADRRLHRLRDGPRAHHDGRRRHATQSRVLPRPSGHARERLGAATARARR